VEVGPRNRVSRAAVGGVGGCRPEGPRAWAYRAAARRRRRAPARRWRAAPGAGPGGRRPGRPPRAGPSTVGQPPWFRVGARPGESWRLGQQHLSAAAVVCTTAPGRFFPCARARRLPRSACPEQALLAAAASPCSASPPPSCHRRICLRHCLTWCSPRSTLTSLREMAARHHVGMVNAPHKQLRLADAVRDAVRMPPCA